MSLVEEGKVGKGVGGDCLIWEWLQEVPNKDHTPHYDEIADS